MNIYYLTQNDNVGEQTYEFAVVVAPSEEAARATHPNGRLAEGGRWRDSFSWAESTGSVKVQLLGSAAEGAAPGVVCRSFRDWF